MATTALTGHARLPLDLVPAKLREIADYCGEDTMWLIWRDYGGCHLAVPRPDNLNIEHKLSRLLGSAAAFQFCGAYGGEILSIAKADAAKRAVRNALIQRARQQGKDLSALARQYDLTERQIMTICRNTQEQTPQLDLFDDGNA